MSAGPMTGYRLEIVTSESRLAAVASVWDDLWRRADGLVFQSHAWVDAWWRTTPQRERRALLIGLVWKGEALDAVLPFATVRRRNIRILEWAAKDHTDYGDILVSPQADHSALRATWRAFVAAGGFDMAYINRLLPDAAARQLVEPQSAALALRTNHRSETSYRVANAWPSGAAWFEHYPKKVRQNYKRGRKFMEETGEVNFRLMAPDEPLGPLLEQVAHFKRKWLARHGRESDLFDEGAPALGALVDAMARLRVLHVFVLECAGAVVAISINLIQRNRMMAFITTYDPEFERCSPGMVLMMDYIQWSFDRGLSMVDFMCGGEDFKRRFATESVTLESMTGARTLLGRAAVAADDAAFAFRTWRAGRVKPAPAAEAAAPSPSHP